MDTRNYNLLSSPLSDDEVRMSNVFSFWFRPHIPLFLIAPATVKQLPKTYS